MALSNSIKTLGMRLNPLNGNIYNVETTHSMNNGEKETKIVEKQTGNISPLLSNYGLMRPMMPNCYSSSPLVGSHYSGGLSPYSNPFQFPMNYNSCGGLSPFRGMGLTRQEPSPVVMISSEKKKTKDSKETKYKKQKKEIKHLKNELNDMNDKLRRFLDVMSHPIPDGKSSTCCDVKEDD